MLREYDDYDDDDGDDKDLDDDKDGEDDNDGNVLFEHDYSNQKTSWVVQVS